MHNHKSTGIASGLEYRPGYRVGGRVGFKHGGSHKSLDVNPELSIDSGFNYFEDVPFGRFISGLGEASKNRLKEFNVGLYDLGATPLNILGETFTGYNPGFSGRRFFDYGPDDEKDTTTFLGIPGFDAERGYIDTVQESMQEEEPTSPYPGGHDLGSLRGYFSTMEGAETVPMPDPDADPKDQVDFIIQSDKERDKRYADLDKLRLAKREEYDAELKALRERQSQDKNRLAILNMVAAANDPNLEVGQSRVAAAAGALTEAARDKAAYRDQIGQQDLEIKGARDEADLAQIFEREERQIQRLEAREDYAKKLQMDKIYGGNTTLIQNIEFLESRIGKLPKEKLEKIFEAAVGGGDVDDMQLVALINSMPEGARKLLREELGLGESDGPIGINELEAFKNSPMYSMGEFLTPVVGVDEAAKDGGIIGYQEGGDVEMQTNEGVPMVMTYDQLRAKLPEFITDDIVKLIAYSPPAFKDFASIETQQDVEEFNDKYDVNLVLPNMDQIDYAMPSDNVDDTSTGQVPVPPAVAANPQMPMQTGTGQLTPTETALLDPTEQAIRMRNR